MPLTENKKVFSVQFKVSYRADSCIKPWGRPGHTRRLVYLTPSSDSVNYNIPRDIEMNSSHHTHQQGVDPTPYTHSPTLVHTRSFTLDYQ